MAQVLIRALARLGLPQCRVQDGPQVDDPPIRMNQSAAARQNWIRAMAYLSASRLGALMDWFSAPDYRLTRFALERGLGLVYLIAFLVALNQFPALLGERGLLPGPALPPPRRFREAPSLFHLRYSDRFLAPWLGGWRSSLSALVAGLPQAGPLWLADARVAGSVAALPLDRQRRPDVLRRSAGSPCCSRPGSSRSSSATRAPRRRSSSCCCSAGWCSGSSSAPG